MHQPRLLSALGLSLAVALTACDDVGGPNGAESFDPESAATDMQAIASAFDTPVFESFTAMGDNFNVAGGGAAPAAALLEHAGRASSDPRGWALASGDELAQALHAVAAAAELVPESFRGRTYTFHPEEGYFHNQERTDAPEDGMRFAIYAVNPITREVALPLNEIGHADVIDESTETSAVIRLIVEADDVQFINYAVSATGQINSLSVAIAGFVTDGTTQVDLDLSNSIQTTFATMRIEANYNVTVPDRDFEVSSTFVLEGDAEADNATATFTVAFSEGENAVSLEGTFDSSTEVANVEVMVNQELFALITIQEDSYDVTGPDGTTPLTTVEAQALEDIIEGFEGVFDVFDDFFDPVRWLFDVGE